MNQSWLTNGQQRIQLRQYQLLEMRLSSYKSVSSYNKQQMSMFIFVNKKLTYAE